jgi:NAD(P)-dependent dehydrogenase (short-subunit alcohol dehydrogenase family)
MSLPSLSLEGKVAIVTGAGGVRGIGRATALTFAEAGANVAVCDISATGETFDLEGTANEIRKLGRQAIAVQADLSKDADVDNLVSKTVKKFGTIDVLANVAGMSIHVPFLETTREIYDKAMDANLRTEFLCCQKVAKVMVEHESGTIINWISLSAYKTGHAYVYGMAKIGATALTAWAANELAKYNIRVNGISPGLVRTDLGPHGIHTVHRNAPPPDEKLEHPMDAMGRNLPLGRICEPQEIADVALFLATDASRMITGQIIIVDGGAMIA